MRRQFFVTGVEQGGNGSNTCAAEIVAKWDAGGGCVGDVVKLRFLDRDLLPCAAPRIVPQSHGRYVGYSEAAAVCRAYWPRRERVGRNRR